MPLDLHLDMTQKEYFEATNGLMIDIKGNAPSAAEEVRLFLRKYIQINQLHNPDFANFKKESNLLFSKQVIFDRLAYRLKGGATYHFELPSEHDVNTLFWLYKLKSNEEYRNGGELCNVP